MVEEKLSLRLLSELDYDSVSRSIQEFIRRSVEGAGLSGVVVGLSGGVDSSTVAALSARALGARRVYGLVMPISTTPKQDVNDALALASGLGIRAEVIDISEAVSVVSSYYRGGGELSRVALGNVAPRIRMATLYLHANSLGYLVAGTGNKSELLVGYFTKYGDGGVDILPIGDLYKTQVRHLASFLGIPRRIIDKTPTAGLWPGQTDEGEMGLAYAELDLALYALVDLGLSVDEAHVRTGLERDKILRVKEMIKNSSHKRSTPPIARLKPLGR